MNIDERLEALAQSVELLAAMQITHEKEVSAALKENARQIADLLGMINSLARIAQRHEERLDRLDGGN